MSATVLLPTVLRPHAGGLAELEASGNTLDDVLDDLSTRYPSLGEQLRTTEGELPTFINVFVGDEDVRYLEGVSTQVPEGAEITILPAVAGG